ncbi:interferon-induced very large GTPase 1-like [Arapaima gigas]
MDCPQCGWTCGDQDKFCSQCGCKLQPNSEPLKDLKEPSVPQKLKICTLDATSVSLSWEAPPDMEGVLHKYNVSWHTNNQPSQSITTKETFTKVDGLNPACDYFLSVRSVLDCNGLESDPLQTTVRAGHEKQNEHGQSQLSERTSSVDEFKGLLKDASEEETANDWTLVDEERCNDQTGDQETETTKLQHVTSDKNAGSRHQNEIEEKGCSEKVASFSNIEESFSDKDTTEEFQDSQETLVNNDEATEENVTGAKKEPTETDDLIVEKITFHSVSLRWRNLTNMQDGNTYTVSWYSSRDKQKLISTTTNTAVISNLNPGTLYTITVKSQNKNGTEYQIWHKTVCTELSQPRKLTVDFVHPTLISLTWRKPHGMDQVPHRFNISYHSSGGKPKFISTKAQEIKLTGLIPGTEYTVSVSTVVENKMQSAAVSKTIFTKPSVPQKLKICTLDATSSVNRNKRDVY